VKIGSKELPGRYGHDDGGATSGICAGGVKPQMLIMEYTGESCSQSRHSQKAKYTKCQGDPRGASPVRILVQQENGRRHTWFEGDVRIGDRIRLDATRARLTGLTEKAKVWVQDATGKILQEFKFRAACDQPLTIGDQFASLKLVDFVPEYTKTATLSRDDESRTRIVKDAIGPNPVKVYDAPCNEIKSGTPVLADLPSSSFTLLPPPIPVVEIEGTVRYRDFDAAVGGDGTLYIAFDMTNVTRPMQFFLVFRELPLRFTLDDVVYYNRDQYNLKLFTSFVSDPNNYQWGPYFGPTVEKAPKEKHSQVIGYWRHEFESYKRAHAIGGSHEVDQDGIHPDGTPHVDHEHLVIAIRGYKIDVNEPTNSQKWLPLAPGKIRIKATLRQLFADGPLEMSRLPLEKQRALYENRYEVDFDTDTGTLVKVERKSVNEPFEEAISASYDLD
jgi:hypothetical protein